MNKIEWCLKQGNGLRLIEPNTRIATGYLKMAEASLGTMNREKDKNIVFSISAGYYTMYYSLYAIMQKAGVKCEIHSCSIEFMRRFLNGFYSEEDIKLIETGFDMRNLLQYYVDKSINKNELEKIWKNAYDFFVKSRDILSRFNSEMANRIRDELVKRYSIK